MTYDVRQMFNVLSRTSPRERTLLSIAGVAVLLTCLYSFALDPLFSGRAELASRAARKQRELREITDLRTKYLDLKQKLGAGQRLLSKTDPDFSLFTYLETTIAQVVPRQRITSMSPDTKEVGPDFQEELVEFKLTRISLEQLVDMLYRIEKAEQPLRVTRLRVRKRPGDIRNFDVTAAVSLLRETS